MVPSGSSRVSSAPPTPRKLLDLVGAQRVEVGRAHRVDVPGR
jgi:hypothetical protein